MLPVDGYPVLPALPDLVASMQADVLADAVAQVAAAAIQRVARVATRTTPVRFVVGQDEDQLCIEAGSGDDVQASDQIPVHADGRLDGEAGGDEPVPALHPSYLMDGLKAFGTSEAEIRVRHPHKPAYLAGRVGDGIDAAYRHLVMPVRLSG
ncbi:hypothetical protein [Kitasatospora sp. NPDC059571]|uniref:hypothetical protein n=1 Tax=Kitasatospora sp. NPDC059571 TaxID=3346871 RepID=UPI0036BE04A5